MKHSFLYPFVGVFVLALPAIGQEPKNGQSFDHHNLPDGPDPFLQQSPPGRHPMEQVPGACREPDPPLSDPASLQVLGLTLGEEYDRYFSDATRYFMCLDKTRADFFETVKQHGLEYRRLLQE